MTDKERKKKVCEGCFERKPIVGTILGSPMCKECYKLYVTPFEEEFEDWYYSRERFKPKKLIGGNYE